MSRVTLTDVGWPIQAQVRAFWMKMVTEMLAGFSTKKLEWVRSFLLRMRVNLLQTAIQPD